MKILKSLGLAALMVIITSAAVQAGVDDYVWEGMESEEVYSHDFEDVTDSGWLNPGHLLTHEKVNQVSVAVNPDGEGKVLKLRNRRWVKDAEGNYQLGDASFNSHGEHMYPTAAGLDTAKEATNKAYATIPLLTGKEQKKRSHQIFSVDFYVETGAIKFGYLGHRFAAGTTSPEIMNNTLIHFGADGKIYRTGNTASPTGFEYEHNKWYNLTFVADTETAKVYTYVTPRGGETLTIDDGRAISGWTSGSYMLTFQAIVASNSEDWVTYIDDYELYIMYYPLPTAVSTYPADGETDVDLYSDMMISFNNEFATGFSPVVTITDNEENEFTDFEAKIVGKDVKISLNKPLGFNTKYTVKLDKGLIDSNDNRVEDDTLFSFTTIPEQLYSAVPVLSCKDIIPEDKKISAFADVINPLADDMTVKLVLAGYDAFNGLTVFSEKEETITKGDSIRVTTQELELTGDEVYVRAYVTAADSLICENFASLNEYKAVSSKKGALENVEVKIDSNIVTVSGNVDSMDSKLLLIEAENSDKTFSTFSPFYAKENGEFSYTFIIPEADGKYTLKLSGRRVSNTQNEEFHYISDVTKERILTAANTKKVSDIKSELEADKEKLNTDLKYFTDNAYEVIYDQKPFEKFEDVIEMMKKAYSLLEEVNNTNWAELGEVINLNSNIILFENEDYEYYAELSETNQNKIHSIIADSSSGFSTLKNFSQAFSDAVYDYKSSKKKPSSGSGGGGGSGGGSSIKQSSSKGSATAQTQPEPVVTPSMMQETFNDLDAVLWAKESINALLDKGIIAKAEDGRYRPNDYITREEFAKLIVTAAGVEIENRVSTMKDVPENAWFAPYVAAGEESGIIFGTGDGMFGVGSYITRQDMAVLISRVIINKAEYNGEIYMDDENIAEYAKEAVYALKAAGIMSGMSEERFEPMGYVTRAQAAKALYEMIKVNENAAKE